MGDVRINACVVGFACTPCFVLLLPSLVSLWKRVCVVRNALGVVVSVVDLFQLCRNMKVTELRRQHGGCFQCSITSTTAFTRRFEKGSVSRLAKCNNFSGTKYDGGIFSSGSCCNEFFICYWCCMGFIEDVRRADERILCVASKADYTFLGCVMKYISDFGKGCFVKLPRNVWCMGCSLSNTSVGKVLEVNLGLSVSGNNGKQEEK